MAECIQFLWLTPFIIVAVTRAQSLLIIVGDPSVLSLDPLWRSFLNFIYLNGGWRGDPPSWDASAEVRDSGGYDEEARDAGFTDMNELARKIETMTISQVIQEDDEEEDGTGDDNVDRPWRELE